MERRPMAATVKTPAENFTGDVYMNPVFNGDGTSRLVVGLVRFTPGARTNWHSHANGQLLQCTDGIGLVVTRDGIAIRRGNRRPAAGPGKVHHVLCQGDIRSWLWPTFSWPPSVLRRP